MGSTTNLGLPWPDLGDTANGSSQIKALAEALDAAGLILKPRVELIASAATTSIGNATETKVNLATTNHLDGGSTYFTVAASVITIVQSGVYDISANTGFSTSSVGTGAYATIFKSNATTRYLANTAGAYGSPNVQAIPLIANDTIELRVYQDSGSGGKSTDHSTGAGGRVSRLMIRKVG